MAAGRGCIVETAPLECRRRRPWRAALSLTVSSRCWPNPYHRERTMSELPEELKAWPYCEAQKIVERFEKTKSGGDQGDKPTLFETGFGPSGDRKSTRLNSS